jgi:hypothetical protein
MEEDALAAVRQELQQARDELDALRSGICDRLHLSARRRGSDGEMITMPTDHTILAAITRLQVTVATYEAPLDAVEPAWAAIDAMIFDSRKIQAIQEIRSEFGDSLQEAVDRLSARYNKLRREKPDGFSVAADTYWDGFHS